MKLDTDSVTNQNAMRVLEAGKAAVLGGDWVIDFSGVVRCDTAAIACVFAWMRLAHSSRRKLELRAIPKDLLSQAELYGVLALIESA